MYSTEVLKGDHHTSAELSGRRPVTLCPNDSSLCRPYSFYSIQRQETLLAKFEFLKTIGVDGANLGKVHTRPNPLLSLVMIHVRADA